MQAQELNKIAALLNVLRREGVELLDSPRWNEERQGWEVKFRFRKAMQDE